MENRKHQRIGMKNLSVNIADGNGFFKGVVSDISSEGMCLTYLPKNLNGNEKILTILVSGKEQNFKMNVTPRWFGQGTTTKSIGVEIAVIPKEWAEFVKNLEPVLLKGVWVESAMNKAVRGIFQALQRR